MPSHLPLVRAGIIETAILGARDLGIPVRRLILQSGLPDLPWGEEDPHQAIPLTAATDFMELLARREGFPLFGIHAVTRAPLTAIRSLHLQFRGCATIHQALLRFMALARLQTSIADYHLEAEGEKAWLLHRGSFPRANSQQADLYAIAGMIEFMRMAAGPEWSPLEIRLTSRPSRHVTTSEYLGTDSIHFDQPARGIAFRRSLLARSPVTRLPGEHPDGLPPSPFHAATFSERLEAILPAYLPGGQLNESLLAGITGVSFRTLQRKLAREGCSYSTLVTRVRMNEARRLLVRTDRKLSEIATALGYANLPNFTRAFRRWAGTTPGEFRKLGRTGRDASAGREP